MTRKSTELYRLPQILLTVILLALASVSSVLAADDEPIAFIGHGGFFDSKGNQIPVTSEFVARAQAYYREKLLSRMSSTKKNEFANMERQLNEGMQAEGQARLVVQQRLLDWLMANSPQLKDDPRMMGKIKALKSELKYKLPERVNMDNFGRGEELKSGEEFKLDPAIENKLKLPQFNFSGPIVFLVTTNKGQAYINECIGNDVPIPPPIGQLDPAGTSGWKSEGFIPQAAQFIVGTPAELRSFQSPSGMCFALPRYSGPSKTTVDLDGVICLSKTTSKVCFWDNQMNGTTFSFPSGTKIPIGLANLAINPAGLYQAGGFELDGGQGGVCTDCHAGQNPYIIHPDVDLGGGNIMGSLPLPTFGPTRYDPIVAADWPQNALSQSPAYVPDACKFCHRNGGIAGAFPHISTALPGYCSMVLAKAIQRTMPPGSPGSQASDVQVQALQAWCGVAPTAGPSNRGDPHLTTTNGINYDFQAAGEFTALRNSATGFELQTRQTPVTTTTTPVASAYTGLASCVSLNTAAALRVGKHRISYQPGPRGTDNSGRMQLRIDGSPVTLPGSAINLGNGNSIAKAASGGGIDVTAADGTRVIITPNFWTSQGLWYLNVEVVKTPAREGTMGHIPADSWLPLAPNGASFGPAPASLADRYVLLNKKFADAWRITATTSLFDYAPGTSTVTFTDSDWPPPMGKECTAPAGKPAGSLEPQTAQRLCREIKDKAAYENCVLDLIMTGDQNMVKAYLLTLKLHQAAGP